MRGTGNRGQGTGDREQDAGYWICTRVVRLPARRNEVEEGAKSKPGCRVQGTGFSHESSGCLPAGGYHLEEGQ